MTEKNGDLKYKTDNAIDEAYRRGYEEKAKEIRDGEYTFYEKGLNDAWKCVLKIGKLDVKEQKSIFGTYTTRQIALAFTVQQAMQKIKDYEERQTDEIKVGDEVKVYDDCIGIVTRHAPQARTCYVMYRDGSCGEEELTDCKKTGNHSMSLDKWLERMRKESHD